MLEDNNNTKYVLRETALNKLTKTFIAGVIKVTKKWTFRPWSKVKSF